VKNYVLYNPTSNNGRGDKVREELGKLIQHGKLIFMDITGIKDIKAYMDSIDISDNIIIAGGDGTLNKFVNDCDILSRDVYYYPCGSGNDFARDVKKRKGLIHINRYIDNLPVCTVNGESKKFFNGVGYGIDGFCCTEGDKIRKNSDKKVNYALIALKGVFKGFKPVNATVFIDGEKKEYKKVWLCASMKGRYYGGGFMMAPSQSRLSEDGKLSLVVAHDASKLVILSAFLFVFSGKHTMFKKNVEILSGYDIKVEFDSPTSLQIDGEGYENILSYEAKKDVEPVWSLKV